MELYVRMTFISTFFLFFLVFKRDFIKRAYFTRISTSNTANDDVTNCQRRIFNTDLLYSCAHFLVETDEKFSQNGGF